MSRWCRLEYAGVRNLHSKSPPSNKKTPKGTGRYSKDYNVNRTHDTSETKSDRIKEDPSETHLHIPPSILCVQSNVTATTMTHRLTTTSMTRGDNAKKGSHRRTQSRPMTVAPGMPAIHPLWTPEAGRPGERRPDRSDGTESPCGTPPGYGRRGGRSCLWRSTGDRHSRIIYKSNVCNEIAKFKWCNFSSIITGDRYYTVIT